MQSESNTPDPREQQRLAALAKGNQVRYARADLKRELCSGQRSPRDVLFDPPDCVLGVPLAEFLTWLPGIKRERAKRIMQGLVYSETLAIGEMSERTLKRVLERIAHYQPSLQYPAGRYGVVEAA